MDNRSKVLIAVLLVMFAIQGLCSHRDSGPRFVFEPPEAITLVEGAELAEREVKFPNFLPFQWSISFLVTPLFKAGDVIEVDLSLLEEGKVDEHSIRIDGKPVDVKDKDVSFSYIFRLINKLPADTKVVRLKIDYVVLDDTIAHHQKQDSGEEWFWLREIYHAHVIPIG